MKVARHSAVVSRFVILLGLLAVPASASVQLPMLADPSGPRPVSTSSSPKADARVFSGAFVAKGETRLPPACRWTETWDFTSVSVDLGRQLASLSGHLISTPLAPNCESRTEQFANAPLAVTVNGSTVVGTATWGDYGISFSGTISGRFLKGTFQAIPRAPWSGTHSGTFNLASSEVTISLTRATLTLLRAMGSPKGGSFAYSARRTAGTTTAGIKPAQGVQPTTNPNSARLKNPPNPKPNGAPAEGGLAEVKVTYTNGEQASKTFPVATFGLSCYNIAAESEWGKTPNNCRSVRIGGVTHAGTVTDPHGLRGVYCASFIAQVRLQGSGETRDGRKIQYEPTTNRISVVQAIHGADGTPVVAGRTLARDRKIIPKKELVDIAGVGTSLEANDTGGRIKGYRIDLFKGAGEAVCRKFANDIVIAACRPGGAKCPPQKVPE